MFYQLIILFIANVLMGITSIFLTDIKDHSIFSVSFARFFLAFVAEFITLLILIFYEKKFINKSFNLQKDNIHQKTSNLPTGFTQLTYTDFLKLYFKHFFFGKNTKTNRKLPHYLQFTIMAICLIDLSIPFYFLGFVYEGVVITTITINAITICSISFMNLWKKEEDFNSLYAIYLILLITSVITAGLGRSSINLQYSLIGLASIIISSVTWVVFLTLTDKSTLVPETNSEEADKVLALNTPYMKINRPLFQTMMIHLIGIILLFPTALFFQIGFSNTFIADEALRFFSLGFAGLIELSFRWNMIGVGIISTFVPYLLVTFTAAIWPRDALKHDQWNSILTTLEPLLNLYIGYFIWFENIKLDYIFITTILLFSSIVIRYFYENGSLLRFYIFLKVKVRHNAKLIDFFSDKGKFVENFDVMCGTWDVIIRASTRSSEKFYNIYDSLRNFEWIDKIDYSMIRSKDLK